MKVKLHMIGLLLPRADEDTVWHHKYFSEGKRTERHKKTEFEIYKLLDLETCHPNIFRLDTTHPTVMNYMADFKFIAFPILEMIGHT